MQTPVSEAESGPVPEDAATAREGAQAQPKPLGDEKPRPEPTRYGDWEKAGRCIDF